MMATAQMQPRQYMGPTSENGRMFPQATQLQQGMYYPNPTWSSNPYAPQSAQPSPGTAHSAQHNPYPQHPGQPASTTTQMMTPPRSALPHRQNAPALSHPHPHPQPSPHPGPMIASPNSQPKFEPGIPRTADASSMGRSPTLPPGPNGPNHPNPPIAAQNGNVIQSGQQGSISGNSSANPGPIPATTPLVVRQDQNGVQWIAFEYSKDRVKVEYTIRCDVESVNVDQLSREFKEANCVYPRAFCDKNNYTGNRLGYETECNTVGWSLVELNSFLREKRGLIQRAVDSWRNSNQDARLRSRRVRRQNKQNTRAKNNQQTGQMTASRDMSAPPAMTNAMLQQRPLPPSMSPAMAPPMHQHHANADVSIPPEGESSVTNTRYDPRPPPNKPHPGEPPTHQRPSNVFHGYSAYPLQPNLGAVAVAPPLPNSMEPHLAPQAVSSTPVSAAFAPSRPPSSAARPDHALSSIPQNLSRLYPNRTGKSFINVSDPGHGHKSDKVRVKLDLSDMDTDEIVDDIRMRNCVYPRSFSPRQIADSPQVQKMREARNFEQEGDEPGSVGIGQTLVRVETLDGEAEVPVPRLGKRVRQKDQILNDLGYRISYSQIRRYYGRVSFLQRSCELQTTSSR